MTSDMVRNNSQESLTLSQTHFKKDFMDISSCLTLVIPQLTGLPLLMYDDTKPYLTVYS